MGFNTFAEFLEASEYERFKYLTSIKLNWWQRLEIKLANKWWTYMMEINPHLRADILWENIYKGRF